MTKKIATPKSRQKYYCLPNDISNKIATSSLIVNTYRVINKTEHQTAHDRLPVLVAVGRLIDDLNYIFTSYIGTPKVRKTSIDQLASKINRAIDEMVKGRIRGMRVCFPIDCETVTYGLRNCDAYGNTSTLVIHINVNGRLRERYCQGGTL